MYVKNLFESDVLAERANRKAYIIKNWLDKSYFYCLTRAILKKVKNWHDMSVGILDPPEDVHSAIADAIFSTIAMMYIAEVCTNGKTSLVVKLMPSSKKNSE